MSEVKEYVSVNEKDFGTEKTLKLNDKNLPKLDSNLRRIIKEKVSRLNAKIDGAYDASFFDSKGEDISSYEKEKLLSQLKDIIKGFNEEISRIEKEYIGETEENISKIQTEISEYFSNKYLFVEKSPGVAVLGRYAKGDAEGAKNYRDKELYLGG